MEYRGYLFTKIVFADYDVLIPFVCEQCGWCCQHYIPRLLPEEVLRIAADEHWQREETLGHYMEDYDGMLHGHSGPCPFLKEDHLCAIHDHPLRPEVCRLYPFSFCDGDEHCPSFRDHLRIVRALTGDAEVFEQYDSSFCPDTHLRPIPDETRPEIRRSFLEADPPAEVIPPFLALNGMLPPRIGKRATPGSEIRARGSRAGQ
jgi:Fe-S-cluster containining protein